VICYHYKKNIGWQMHTNKKQEILQQLAEARLSHAKWLRRAKHLIEGLPVKDGMIPIDPTDCAFGQWFYKDAVRYKNVLSFAKHIEKIGSLHVALHDVYLHIYKIYFVDARRSRFMSTILASQYKSPSKSQQELTQHYFIELQKISNELNKELETLEKLVLSLDKQYFELMAS